MNELQRIQQDLEEVHKKFNAWYDKAFATLHYDQHYPYLLLKTALGQAKAFMQMVIREQEAKKK